MIWVIFVVFVGLTLFIVDIDEENAITTFLAASISLIIAIGLMVCVSFTRTIDDKIAMYQEENSKIESQIEVVVEKYMEYESDTFAELSSESIVTLATVYPELKSNELVQGQIELYIKNNEKIIKLKESKINAGVARWWLYFGK